MTARRRKIKPMTPGVSRAARVRAYLAGAVVTLGLCRRRDAKRGRCRSTTAIDYRALAERQHAMRVDIPAPRGEVARSRAAGRSRISADADSIWANPREVRDVTGTADKLAR